MPSGKATQGPSLTDLAQVPHNILVYRVYEI